MHRRLKIALMPVLAASFSLTTPSAIAAPGESSASHLVATTDESGRTIYTNEYAEISPSKSSQSAQAVPSQSSPSSRLAYWSSKEGRWKPVPSARMGRARTAAAEVNQYLNRDNPEEGPQATSFMRSNRPFSAQDVD